MGYFPNGSAGSDFQERQCFKCVNYRDLNDGRGPGCPIFDLHLMWNYDAVGVDGEQPKKFALDHFIPLREDKLGNADCNMFIRISDAPARSSEAGPGVGGAVESNTADENGGSAETGGEKADV